MILSYRKNHPSIFIFLLCVLLTFIFYHPVKAQEDLKNFQFLQRGQYFQPILLDPHVSLPYAGIHRIIKSKGDEFKGIYIPVTLGFQQSFVRYRINEKSGLELGLEAAAYTQFQIQKWENNTYLGEMVNADYRVSGYLNYKIRILVLQLKVFHQSSHLADDYILRNEINTPNPGTQNYEQVDLLASYQIGKTRIYGGTGLIYNPNNIRKRLSFQAGFYFRKPNRKNPNIRFVFGSDIKIQQHHQFRPNIKSALGMELGEPDKVNLGFFLEYYNGYLPFSVLEYNLVNWIGLSCLLVFPSQ